MSETENKKEISRNNFIKIGWGALAGLVALEIGGVTLAYMQPRLGDGEFGGIIEAGEVDTFPPGSVTQITSGRFYLSRLLDGGFWLFTSVVPTWAVVSPGTKSRKNLFVPAIIRFLQPRGM